MTMLCYRVKGLDMPENPILVYMIACSQAVSGLIKGRDSLLLALLIKNKFRLVTNVELKIYLFDETMKGRVPAHMKLRSNREYSRHLVQSEEAELPHLPLAYCHCRHTALCF